MSVLPQPAKTSSASFRMDVRTRLWLEILAKIRNTSMTQVLKDLIREEARRVGVLNYPVIEEREEPTNVVPVNPEVQHGQC